jgi:hypothetical protein
MGRTALHRHEESGAPFPRDFAGDFDDQHAAHIDEALSLADAAAGDLVNVSVKLEELLFDYREALKAALAGKVMRITRNTGNSFPCYEWDLVRPGVVRLLQEACRELDLDAESAG